MTFEQKQSIRKAKRNRHQRLMNKLMHVLGWDSAGWAVHKYSIERRVKGLGRVNLKTIKTI